MSETGELPAAELGGRHGTAALAGLMKAAAASGDAGKAAELKARLQAIWRRADRKVSDALR